MWIRCSPFPVRASLPMWKDFLNTYFLIYQVGFYMGIGEYHWNKGLLASSQNIACADLVPTDTSGR